MKSKIIDEGKKNAKSFIKGFKEFITKGNVVDLAVGVVIGGAFGKIVNSLVKDIIMPPIGILIGGANYTDLKIVLKEAVIENQVVVKPEVAIGYGNFITVIFEFLIIALAIYTALTVLIKFRQFIEKEEEKKQEDLKNKLEEKKQEIISEEILLLREIRDSLKKNDQAKWW